MTRNSILTGVMAICLSLAVSYVSHASAPLWPVAGSKLDELMSSEQIASLERRSVPAISKVLACGIEDNNPCPQKFAMTQ